MKILICAFQFKGGSLQVVLSLINEFRQFLENEYHVIISKEVQNQLALSEFTENFKFYSMPYFSIIKAIHIMKRNKYLNEVEKKVSPDCVLSTSGPAYWRSKAPHLMGFNLPANIYIDSPFFKKLTHKKQFKWWIKRVAHRYFFRKEASAFFVQTDDVNERLKKYIKRDEIYTISNTYSNVFKNRVNFENKLPERKGNEIRLLTISTYYPHKNFEIIKLVIDELEKRKIHNVVFVLTIQSEFYTKIFGNQYKNKVINLGPIKSDECPSLYKECDYMFLPTLLECFSASYAEAMIMQKPILTSNLGFAHTVCKTAALYFDPINPIDIVDKIELLLSSPNLRHELISKGNMQLAQFGSAEDRAVQILKLCEKLKGKEKYD